MAANERTASPTAPEGTGQRTELDPTFVYLPPQLRKRRIPRLYENTWQQFLHKFRFTPYSNVPVRTSVNELVTNACRNKHVPLTVAVQVNNLEICQANSSGSAILSDATASIQCTILENVFDALTEPLSNNSVLVLQDITAILYPMRKATGYNVDIWDGLHVTFAARNIASAFTPKEELPFTVLPMKISYSLRSTLPPVDVHNVIQSFRSGCGYSCDCCRDAANTDCKRGRDNDTSLLEDDVAAKRQRK